MLLAAAIEEAIIALQSGDPVDVEDKHFASPAEYVRYLAWQEQGNQQAAEEFSAKRTSQTTA
jgi:hypothetical protein